MTEIFTVPRFELESQPAPRLEPEYLPVPVAPPSGRRSIALAAGGAAVLLLGLGTLGIGNFVAAQFDRSAVLGGLTLAVAATGLALIATGIWREARGLLALQTVDRLRLRLADPSTARQAARGWLATLPDAGAILPAIDASREPEAIAALLRAGPVATLRAQSDALARAAAMQVFAITAAIPAPAFDGLLVAWRGIRLVRQIAELHGLRPGLLGTLALLRRTAFSAAAVATTDIAVDAATRAVVSNPLLQHLAGDVAGAGVAARRMIVLARAACAACGPLPPR